MSSLPSPFWLLELMMVQPLLIMQDLLTFHSQKQRKKHHYGSLKPTSTFLSLFFFSPKDGILSLKKLLKIPPNAQNLSQSMTASAAQWRGTPPWKPFFSSYLYSIFVSAVQIDLFVCFNWKLKLQKILGNGINITAGGEGRVQQRRRQRQRGNDNVAKQ